MYRKVIPFPHDPTKDYVSIIKQFIKSAALNTPDTKNSGFSTVALNNGINSH